LRIALQRLGGQRVGFSALQAEMKRRGITERDLFRRALHMRIQLAPDIRIFKSGKQFFVSWL